MKFLFFLISVFLISNSKAQSATGYIAFHFIDSLNQPVNPNDFELIAGSAKTMNETKNMITDKIQFDPVNHFYILQLSESLQTSIIFITVKNKKQAFKQSELLINLNAKFRSPDEFQNLLIMNIPVDHPKLIIDMPAEKISWQYVPKAVKIIDGTERSFMDITFMQNWWNQ